MNFYFNAGHGYDKVSSILSIGQFRGQYGLRPVRTALLAASLIMGLMLDLSQRRIPQGGLQRKSHRQQRPGLGFEQHSAKRQIGPHQRGPSQSGKPRQPAGGDLQLRDQPADLSGWTLKRSTGAVVARIPDNITSGSLPLAPGSFLLL